MVFNAVGVQAVNSYNQEPYIDGSCRREPDFQNKYPSISSLCRGYRLVSRLNPNDFVVYCTVRHTYPGKYKYTRFLTAVLKVIDSFDTHTAASQSSYYSGNLPINCMVPNNPPKPFLESCYTFPEKGGDIRFLSLPIPAQTIKANAIMRVWNQDYQDRADAYGKLVVTKPLHLNYRTPLKLKTLPEH